LRFSDCATSRLGGRSRRGTFGSINRLPYYGSIDNRSAWFRCRSCRLHNLSRYVWINGRIARSPTGYDGTVRSSCSIEDVFVCSGIILDFKALNGHNVRHAQEIGGTKSPLDDARLVTRITTVPRTHFHLGRCLRIEAICFGFGSGDGTDKYSVNVHLYLFRTHISSSTGHTSIFSRCQSIFYQTRSAQDVLACYRLT
jgi:hypothetical protein